MNNLELNSVALLNSCATERVISKKTYEHLMAHDEFETRFQVGKFHYK